MNLFSLHRILWLPTLISLLALFPATAQDSVELAPIFNGRNLTGWEIPKQKECWTVVDGEIWVKNNEKQQGSILWTDQAFSDFELTLEFKIGEGTVDSGVFLRTEKQQIQIGESGSLKRDMTCSPYIPGKGYPVEAEGIADLLKKSDWNSMKIRAVGPQYTIWLNGAEVLSYESEDVPQEGKIGLQLHAKRNMEIAFRNLRLAEIE